MSLFLFNPGLSNQVVLGNLIGDEQSGFFLTLLARRLSDRWFDSLLQCKAKV